MFGLWRGNFSYSYRLMKFYHTDGQKIGCCAHSWCKNNHINRLPALEGLKHQHFLNWPIVLEVQTPARLWNASNENFSSCIPCLQGTMKTYRKNCFVTKHTPPTITPAYQKVLRAPSQLILRVIERYFSNRVVLAAMANPSNYCLITVQRFQQMRRPGTSPFSQFFWIHTAIEHLFCSSSQEVLTPEAPVFCFEGTSSVKFHL